MRVESSWIATNVKLLMMIIENNVNFLLVNVFSYATNKYNYDNNKKPKPKQNLSSRTYVFIILRKTNEKQRAREQ